MTYLAFCLQRAWLAAWGIPASHFRPPVYYVLERKGPSV